MSDDANTGWEPVGSGGAASSAAGSTAGTDRVGFCQNCGKPLDKDTIRRVGTAVYCEPCLEMRLHGAPAAGAAKPGTGAAGDTVWQWGAGMPQGWTPPSGPNPGLALLLGFIPGVGAMYNEQYAKGIVHLVIFAVLSSLGHSVGIFGLFAFAWVCYMAFDAYHTAKARREGTPLPNPFGLNDIGDRMGFVMKDRNGFPMHVGVHSTRPATAPPATPAPSAAEPPVYPAASEEIPTRASWGAPQDQYSYTNVPPVPPVPPAGSAYGPGYAPGYEPVANPYAYAPATYPPFDGMNAPPVPVRSRFPAGAIWLIALGTIFLVGNTGMFRDVPESALVGFAVATLGVWLFVRKMITYNTMPEYAGGTSLGWRMVRASRGAVWLLLVGGLLVLNAFHLVEWTQIWPYFLILAGVMALLERTVSNSAAMNYRYGFPGQQPGAGGYGVAPTVDAKAATASSPEEGR